MAVTDQQILEEAQYALQEPPDLGATFPSGLWTRDEVLDALDLAQRTFLKDTLCVMKTALLPATPNTHRHAVPEDWIATQRVAWWGPLGTSSDDLDVRSLERGDGYEADHGLPSWTFAPGSRPVLFMDAELPTLQLQIAPAASDHGQLEVLYVYLSAELDGSGVALTVPDECAPSIKWKMLATLLGKMGRAYDPARAAYCQLRYDAGVAAVRLLLEGGP